VEVGAAGLSGGAGQPPTRKGRSRLDPSELDVNRVASPFKRGKLNLVARSSQSSKSEGSGSETFGGGALSVSWVFIPASQFNLQGVVQNLR